MRRPARIARAAAFAPRSPAALALALFAAVAVAVAGCTPEQLAANPLGPCGDDARSPGGYVELEVLLPRALGPDARGPDRIDSGRSCSDQALGTLKQHGVTELRFAGATWEEGGSEGTVIAVFTTPNAVPPLQQAWVEEFYEAGARAGKKTDNVTASRRTYGSAGEAFRVDVLNDLSQQTVIVLPGDSNVRVVIVATEVTPGASIADHDSRVERAVAAADAALPPGGEPVASPGG